MKEKCLPLAIGLNILLPGIGHIYLGKRIVGIFAAAGTPYIFPTWTGLNAIMGIDMVILI